MSINWQVMANEWGRFVNQFTPTEVSAAEVENHFELDSLKHMLRSAAAIALMTTPAVFGFQSKEAKVGMAALFLLNMFELYSKPVFSQGQKEYLARNGLSGRFSAVGSTNIQQQIKSPSLFWKVHVAILSKAVKTVGYSAKLFHKTLGGFFLNARQLGSQSPLDSLSLVQNLVSLLRHTEYMALPLRKRMQVVDIGVVQ